MSVTEEDLSAFADGALEGDARARVAAEVAADPALQRRVARMRAAAAALRDAFDPVLAEPVPQRFMDLIAAPPARGQVISFPGPRSRVAWAMAAAACLLVTFAAGRFTAPAPAMQMADGRIAATGALQRALNAQASGAAGPVQIALSFATEDGYCRVFQLETGAGATGLACGARDDWTVVALSSASAGAGKDGYRQAAGALPDAILEAAAARRAGDPLDAGGEAAAIRDGWAKK